MKKVVKFHQEKVTKNTIKFTEETDILDTAPVDIGAIYVQKHALASIGYKEGQTLIVTIEVEAK